MFGSIRKFFSDVGLELKKTSWPWDAREKGFKKFKELTDSTVVVIVAVVLLGLRHGIFHQGPLKHPMAERLTAWVTHTTFSIRLSSIPHGCYS